MTGAADLESRPATQPSDVMRARFAPAQLLARAQISPQARAYGFVDAEGDTEITWCALARQASGLARLLSEHAQPGDRVLILAHPGLDYIVALFACFFNGLVAVPAYPPRSKRRVEALVAIAVDCNASVVVADSRGVCSLGETDALRGRLSECPILQIDSSKTGEIEGFIPLAPDDLAVLQYTSGSTGAPKGVMLTHGNLVANLEAQRALYEVGPASRGVIWLPPHHDMGLGSGILQPLFSGSEILLMDPAFAMQRPIRWLEAVDDFGATVSGGPPFAFAACTAAMTAAARQGRHLDLDLSRWACAFVGAEPISPMIMEEFCAAASAYGFRPDAITPSYGLAEATLLVTGTRGGIRLRGGVAGATVSCGPVIPGHEVLVVDVDTGLERQDGDEGEVWIAGPSVAAGYWRDPARTRQVFQATLADGRGPYLRTGDLGILHGGELAITGRLKDVVIIAGRKLHAADIEATARGAAPAIAAAATAAFAIRTLRGERLVIMIEQPRELKADVHDQARLQAAVRAAIAGTFDVIPHDIELVRFGALPRTSSGKLRRHLCRELYLSREGADAW